MNVVVDKMSGTGLALVAPSRPLTDAFREASMSQHPTAEFAPLQQPGMKFCPKCKRDRPQTEYRKYSRTRDGLQAWCKECFRNWRPGLLALCEWCGCRFRPRRKANARFCSTPCRAVAIGNSPDYRRKMSEVATGRKPSAEARAKMSASRTGKVHGEESRAKMAESRRRLLADPAERRKMAAAVKEACNRPEYLAKVSGPNHPLWKADRITLRLRRRMKHLAHSLIWRSLGRDPRRSAHTVADLGYTPEELRLHLERHFLPGMTWDNYGRRGWHVDHKRPICSFPLGTPVSVINALGNLQPLWWRDNMVKGSRVDAEADR